MGRTDARLQAALAGDEQSLAAVFADYRPRLRQMVRLRLDTRIQARVDPSDVLQEAYLDVRRRLPEYLADPKLPFLLWLRMLVGQRLLDVHRQHLGARMRSASLEISLNAEALPQASSESLAAHYFGNITSASHAVERAENQRLVQDALNAMDPLDREILALRHFEMLSNGECAQALKISKTAASNRYIRALKRVKRALVSKSGHPYDSRDQGDP